MMPTYALGFQGAIYFSPYPFAIIVPGSVTTPRALPLHLLPHRLRAVRVLGWLPYLMPLDVSLVRAEL